MLGLGPASDTALRLAASAAAVAASFDMCFGMGKEANDPCRSPCALSIYNIGCQLYITLSGFIFSISYLDHYLKFH